jgi:Putative lactococcus lactis phage r1t holin
VKLPRSKKYLDLLERTGWTAVQAFAGVIAGLSIANQDVQWDTVFISAGVAALIAVAKGILAFQFGNDNSAALPETEPLTPQG